MLLKAQERSELIKAGHLNKKGESLVISPLELRFKSIPPDMERLQTVLDRVTVTCVFLKINALAPKSQTKLKAVFY
jgi:hypothetical protein